MFAIGIWDERKRRLVLVRDRMGQKPIVYCHSGNRLLFASELKSLLAVGGVSSEIRNSAIDEFMVYGYLPHPHTVYEGIYKLPPASMAVYQDGKLTLSCYWNPDLTPDQSLGPTSCANNLTRSSTKPYRCNSVATYH